MKKLLLIAAMAALALGVNAEGYKFEKVWELNSASIGIDKGNIRQGFGMNGKFYINDKNTADGAVPTIYEVDENGLTGVTFPGGRNCGITYDQAGNIVVSDAVFPTAWVEAGIKVINPTTGETKDYVVPAECGLAGRCDFLGIAMGNMMEDGALFLTGKTPGTEIYTSGIAVFTVTGGEVDVDNCYLAPTDFLAGETATNRDNMTVMNFYEDINGVPTVLYVFRSYSGNDVVKVPYGSNGFDEENITTVDLPGKGACAGTCPFLWDGKEFFVYPTTPNYFDGFAIAEANSDPIVTVPATVSANMNAFQSNWVNAEVDADGVTIYQYAPGANFAVWRLSKEAPEPTKVYMLGGDDQGWDCTQGTQFDYDAENNVYTATITFPAEYNYFGFTTELAENNDDGGWAYIEPFRFGAIADAGTDYWYSGEEEFISLTWDDYHAIRIPGGKYELTINLDDMKLYIKNTYLRGDVNKDGEIDIADVTALIAHVLSKDYTESETFSPGNADVNFDTVIDIADVTVLINRVLSKSW